MAKRSAPTIDDVIDQVAEDVIGLLDREEVDEGDFQGVVKNPALSVPRNAITQRPYGGFNVIRGMLAMMRMGTMDGRFCTVAKAREYSGEKVYPLKGSMATRMMRPISVSARKDGAEDGSPGKDTGQPGKLTPHELALGDDSSPGEEKNIVGFKPFPIFHVSELQVSDMEPFSPPPLEGSHAITSHELVQHFVSAAGARVEPGASPCFIPGTTSRPGGVISMPLPGDHHSPDSWAADMLHEFYHWTGTPDRQNRFDYLEDGITREEALERFTAGYPLEEVRAEFFACLAGRMLGLEYDIRQHASYIDFWSGKAVSASEDADIREERTRVIRSVIQDVAPIVAGLNSFMLGEQPNLKWFPAQSEWPQEARAYFAGLGISEGGNAKLEDATAEAEEPLNIPPALAASFADQGDGPVPEQAAIPNVTPSHDARQPKPNKLNIERHSRPWGRVNTINGSTPRM